MDAAQLTSPVVLVTGADTPLGGAVVRALASPVLAGGADHGVLSQLAGDGVLPLTLSTGSVSEMRVVQAVAADRFGGVAVVLHLAGFARPPAEPGALGARVAHADAVRAGLPGARHVVVVEKGALRGDPAAPLRAAAAAALLSWSRSVGAEVVSVPATAHPPAWAQTIAAAVSPSVRGRVFRAVARLGIRRRSPR